MSTASALLTLAESKASIDSSSIGIAGLETTHLLTVIDKANREYYTKFLHGGGEAPVGSESGGDLAADTTLNGAITSASVSIILDSVTDYPSSGSGAVWTTEPDFIAYTGISTLTLTGVTGINYDHADAAQFSILYALPADFESFRSAQDSPDGVKVNGIPYRFTTGVPVGNQFARHGDYLLFSRGTTGHYSLTYNAGVTAITSTRTAVQVPLIDEDFIVFRLVEHMTDILYGMGSTQSQVARQRANAVMLSALKRRNVGKRLRHGRQWGRTYRNGVPLHEYQNSL